MATKMVLPSGTKAPDADFVDGIDSTAFIRTTHAANSITGFGGTGSATTVSRSDHNHSGTYESANSNIQSHISNVSGIVHGATSANTANMIVSRDSSGNFSAGTISAALNGNASTATKLQTARKINGVNFDGTADIIISAEGSSIFATDIVVNGLTVGRGSGNADSNTAVGSGALANNTTGNSNTAIGYSAILQNKTGSDNTAIGYQAFYKNNSGSDNVAIGSEALYENRSGKNNVAIGNWALQNNGKIFTAGEFVVGTGYIIQEIGTTDFTKIGAESNTVGIEFDATGVGEGTGTAAPNANYNVAVGNSALYNNISGRNNTAIGDAALYANTTGHNNTTVGSSSLYCNTVGSYNVAIGNESLYHNITGNDNIALGDDSLHANISGSDNISIGMQALSNNGKIVTAGEFIEDIEYTIQEIGTTDFTKIGASSNTVGIKFTATGIGEGTGTASPNADYNIAIGNSALFRNTTGQNNTVIGHYSLDNNTIGYANIAIGNSAILENVVGSDNVAIGYNALYNNGKITTAGNFVVGTGYIIQEIGTTDFTKIGAELNTVGIEFTATGVGEGTGTASPSTSSNTAIGNYALENNTTGDDNTAIGMQALGNNTIGDNNVAIGHIALLYNTIGRKNVAIGDEALYHNITGNNNVAIGSNAGKYQDNGSAVVTNANNSIYIGVNSKGYGDSNDNSIVIGANAVGKGANTVVLGNDNITDTYLRGIVHATTFSGNATTATKLQTARKINGVAFDGTQDITIASSGSSSSAFATDITVNGLTVGKGSGNIVNNTALGILALANNATGENNTAIGMTALYNNKSGTRNIAIGNLALYNNSLLATAGNFIADNEYTIQSIGNTDFTTIGASANTVGTKFVATGVGSGTGTASPNAINNTAIGYQALYKNINGSENIAIGYEALYKNISGINNNAIGNDALYYNTTGNFDVAIGYEAAKNNTTGNCNTAIGSYALNANTTSNFNVAIGNNALASNTTGARNTAIGYEAGCYQPDGHTALATVKNSIYIGSECRGYNDSDDNAIVIGADAIGKGSNTVVLGNDSITDTYLKGTVHGNFTISGGTSQDYNQNYIPDGLLTNTTVSAPNFGNGYSYSFIGADETNTTFAFATFADYEGSIITGNPKNYAKFTNSSTSEGTYTDLTDVNIGLGSFDSNAAKGKNFVFTFWAKSTINNKQIYCAYGRQAQIITLNNIWSRYYMVINVPTTFEQYVDYTKVMFMLHQGGGNCNWGGICEVGFTAFSFMPSLDNYYTKAEIDGMVGDIKSALGAINGVV